MERINEINIFLKLYLKSQYCTMSETILKCLRKNKISGDIIFLHESKANPALSINLLCEV